MDGALKKWAMGGTWSRRKSKLRRESLVPLELIEVVAEAGIEPATQGFSVLCSTN